MQEPTATVKRYIGDFGDFGVSDVATVAGRYTRRGACACASETKSKSEFDF